MLYVSYPLHPPLHCDDSYHYCVVTNDGNSDNHDDWWDEDCWSYHQKEFSDVAVEDAATKKAQEIALVERTSVSWHGTSW